MCSAEVGRWGLNGDILHSKQSGIHSATATGELPPVYEVRWEVMFSVCSHLGDYPISMPQYFHSSHVLSWGTPVSGPRWEGTPVPDGGTPKWGNPHPGQDGVPPGQGWGTPRDGVPPIQVRWGTFSQGWDIPWPGTGYPQASYTLTSYAVGNMPVAVPHRKTVLSIN